MRARYVGGDAETTTFGKRFHRWQWVGVDALTEIARETLSQNPQFETDGEAADPVEPGDQAA
jgi:hypothetical protein